MRRSTARSTATLLIFSATAALGARPAAAQEAQGGILGEVVAVENRAEFSLGSASLQPLRPRDPMVREMRVLTYAESEALMTYDHPRAALFLGPETEFLVRPPSEAQEYRCPDPELVARLADLEETRGEIRLVRERARESCPLRVLTPAAVVVVTGTDLRVRVDPADGSTVVSVTEGSVEVYRRDPANGLPTGKAVHLGAGDVSVVAPGRAPSLPAPQDPSTSLLSPATEATALPEPLGSPYPAGCVDLREFCAAAANQRLAICQFETSDGLGENADFVPAQDGLFQVVSASPCR